MAKIQINNPRQTINGGAKKYYFKVKGLGGPKGDKGDKGDTGSRGPQGEPGNAATVYVGSTTTLPVGQDATVENVGTQYNAVLNFGIPQGPRGPQGIQGERGEPGQTGQTGPRGPQGERGTNATVYVGTTTTTNPGTQARVYNSGTDSNAVLNFEIPRGDVGPQPELVQTTGTSTTKAMSQNATTEALNGKQNTLTAGANIQIQNGTISATDTTYTAGNGLNLNGTEFSADTDVLATKSDLDGYYTKPETDNLLAPKIEAEVVAELPTAGAKGKLYLTPKAHTTQTATGNPITATVAEEAGKIESFQLDGDTYQQSYTGKNLLPLNGSSDTGIRGIVNADGSLTIKGTAEASKGLKVFTTTRNFTAGTYTFSISNALSSILNFTLASNVGFRIPAGETSVTTTLEQDYGGGSIFFLASNGTEYDFTIKAQLVSGSTPDYDFEPYVGGVPSPNPDYPQPIQTVTGLQTVEVHGKNLLPTYVGLRTVAVSGAELRFDSDGNKIILNSDFSEQTASAGQQIEITTGDIRRWAWTTIEAIESAPDRRITPNGGDYTASIRVSNGEWSGNTIGLIVLVIGIADDSTGTIRLANKTLNTAGTTGPFNVTQSISLGDNEHIRNIAFYTQNMAFNNAELTVQLELGSTATAYAPYNATSYPISLGTTELCKLGTYQDYIYKDGDDWKVHKATKTITASSNDFSSTSSSGGFRRAVIALAGIANSGSVSRRVGSAITNLFHSSTADEASAQFQTLANMVVYASSTTQTYQELMDSIDESGMIVTYALATPTDTVITNQALIDQLEAIRTALLQNGANTITNTATGSNLAGDMEIGYYGYNPRNRYDKWLWLDIDNEYEQIGS